MPSDWGVAPIKWNAQQLANAAIIIRVGREVGASERDIITALSAAQQESELLNIKGGDRDSAGLFQQRPSMGWGSYEEVTDPEYAARTFFLGKPGNPGLFSIKNRDQLSITQAAQKVQRSAYPDAYAKWEDDAVGLIAQLGGGSAPSGMAMPRGGTAAPTPIPPMPEPVPIPSAAMTPAQQQVSGVSTPGIGEVSAPGAGSVLEEPNLPPDPEPMDFQTFAQTFPDAAELGTFTAPIYGSTLYGAPTYSPGMDGRRQSLVSAAYQWIGTPYQWGGTSRSGADCSGFLQSLFKSFGIDLPRISADQARSGVQVPMAEAKPGDLVAWDNSSRNDGADHIALYVGGNQIIELPRPGLSGRIRKLDPDEGGYFVRLGGL